MKRHHFYLSALFYVALVPAFAAQAAAPDDRGVAHDAENSAVHNTFGHCVRTQWDSGDDECQPAPVAAPASVQVPQSVRTVIPAEERTVYFEFNQSRLLDSERKKINSLTTELESMHNITGVQIVGYADRMGSEGYNKQLSERRAEIVEGYLRQQGYLKTSIAQTQWLGETVPVTRCDASLSRPALIECLQSDRRVTIEINYQESPSNVNPTN